MISRLSVYFIAKAFPVRGKASNIRVSRYDIIAAQSEIYDFEAERLFYS